MWVVSGAVHAADFSVGKRGLVIGATKNRTVGRPVLRQGWLEGEPGLAWN